MPQTRESAIAELLEHAEHAVEHFAPALGSYAVAAMPLVKKGFKLIAKLLREHTHADAEQILDQLLEGRAERMKPIPDEPA